VRLVVNRSKIFSFRRCWKNFARSLNLHDAERPQLSARKGCLSLTGRRPFQWAIKTYTDLVPDLTVAKLIAPTETPGAVATEAVGFGCHPSVTCQCRPSSQPGYPTDRRRLTAARWRCSWHCRATPTYEAVHETGLTLQGFIAFLDPARNGRRRTRCAPCIRRGCQNSDRG